MWDCGSLGMIMGYHGHMLFWAVYLCLIAFDRVCGAYLLSNIVKSWEPKGTPPMPPPPGNKALLRDY